MRHKLLIGILWMLLGSPYSSALANDHEHELLRHLYRQLDSLTPVLVQAQQAHHPHQRRRFHYHAFTDHLGHTHAGLIDDVEAIKRGILAYLNDQRQQPRHVAPIAGDYQS